jgi:hypothetical protein
MTYKLNPFTGKLDTSDGPQGPAGVVSAAGPGSQGTPSISFAADLDTGLYNYTPNGIAVSTGGTGRLFIDASGNVGIGGTTTTGWAQKQVVLDAGSGAAASYVLVNDTTGRTAADGGLLTLSGSDLYLINRESANLIFRTANLERLRITSDGKVGIGTTSPQSIIDISKVNGGDVYITNPTNYGTTPGANPTSRVSNGISWRGNNVTGFGSNASIGETNFIRSVLEDTSTGNSSVQGRYALTFGTAPGGAAGTPATERVRIDGSGRLLVGTSSWSGSNLVTIQGNTSTSTGGGELFLARGASAGTILENDLISRLSFGDRDDNNYAIIQCEADGGTASGDYPGRLVFFTTADGASSPTERMRIKSDGTVDIAGDLVLGPNSAPAVKSDTTGVTGADQITNMMSLTQAEYDAISSPDANTFYIITA